MEPALAAINSGVIDNSGPIPGNIIRQGATPDGKDSTYVEGQKDQKFYAVQSVNKTTTDSKTSDSFLG